ncbi:hypothetical protein V2J09_011328 [Rumex salicifolius]
MGNGLHGHYLFAKDTCLSALRIFCSSVLYLKMQFPMTTFCLIQFAALLMFLSW